MWRMSHSARCPADCHAFTTVSGVSPHSAVVRTSTGSHHRALRCFARNDAKEVVVGVDLGTTNSAVAHIHNSTPVCIPNSEGDTLTPSVVSFLEDGSTIVGKAAKKRQTSAAGTTYYSFKRLIGRYFKDPVVQEEAARVAYKVCTCLPFTVHIYVLVTF